MDKQALFQELGELIQIAKTNGDQISKKEIISYFEELELNDEIITTLCDYFLEAGIKVIGYEKQEEETKEITPEDIGVIAFYEDELRQMDSVSEEEKEQLFQRFSKGEDVREELIESMLSDVVGFAKEYQGQGVMFGDLIQEGNIGLLEALMDIKGDNKDVKAKVYHQIRQAMEEMIMQQKGSNAVGDAMAKKANRLDEAATYLAKKFEREASAQELADYLSMDVEEVKDIMKLSLDAISVMNTEITPAK
ncbi:MAG: sigma-70 family RNA polymerase sigma factor [Anaerostipes sp.]|nr:sigma-70 family RNA polymerase sigma factor [Anaerostipes sp.]